MASSQEDKPVLCCYSCGSHYQTSKATAFRCPGCGSLYNRRTCSHCGRLFPSGDSKDICYWCEEIAAYGL